MTAQIFKVLDRDYQKIDHNEIKQEIVGNSENHSFADNSQSEPPSCACGSEPQHGDPLGALYAGYGGDTDETANMKQSPDKIFYQNIGT